jgi:membrane-bound lytic murein transglycosylase MltF
MTHLTYKTPAGRRSPTVRGTVTANVVRSMKKPSSYIKAYALLFFLTASAIPTGLFGTNEAYVYGPKELGDIFKNALTLGLKLSPFDDMVQRHSARHRTDWRLISSIIYAESRFQHDAVSPMGARGLMQVMPIAAKQQGESLSDKPEENIRTGIRHFLWGKEKLIGNTEDDEISLALAAYNAGLGHVRDAQILAKKMGKSTRSWKNIRAMLLLLEQPQYYKDAKYGYVKGTETVAYVAKVKKQYKNYRDLFPKKSQIVKAIANSNKSDV